MKQDIEPLGDGVKKCNRNEQNLCRWFQHRGKIDIQSQSNYKLSGGKEEHEQTINTEHWKMNSILTLEESFSGHLKEQTEHSMYEFRLLYTYFRHERKHNGRDKLEKHSHEKGSNLL